MLGGFFFEIFCLLATKRAVGHRGPFVYGLTGALRSIDASVLHRAIRDEGCKLLRPFCNLVQLFCCL